MRVLALFALAAAAFAGDDVVFRSDVALVHVEAAVTAADGRILTGFGKDDFRVFDEGKEQSILHFSAEDEPLDLILLFDVSGSMSVVVEGVSHAAGEGLHELRQGDRVCVMVFNSRSRVLAPFTEDLDAVEWIIRERVLGGRFGGGTLIQEAVDDAALKLMKEKKTQRRRAVLIITDNMGMRTRREESVVHDFWEADAILSGLIVSNPKFQRVHPAGMILNLAMGAGMKGIAQKSGGDAIQSDNAGTAFQESMHRIRSRYSLYYALPKGKAGSVRSVKVELAPDAAKQNPKSHVRARTGYVMPG